MALRARRPIMIIELAVMASWIPPIVLVLGGAWPWVAAWGVAFMLFRALACAVLDYRSGGELVTRFSLAEVVNTAPEGILCFKADGSILVVNDVMRRLLETLGCRSVLIDAREVRQMLLGDAVGALECVQGVKGGANEAWIKAPDSTKWHLVIDDVQFGLSRCERVIATDVTELMELNDALDVANAKLALMEDDLRASLAVVDATAELAALARMRSRVHDVIGQRLSILHRALEDGDLSRGRLSELREIVDTIMADLAMRERIDPQADLISIKEAFSLIGVAVGIAGVLPERDDVADAFVRIVREAVTNAVRHAHATSVEVRFSSPDCAGLPDAPDGQGGCSSCWALTVRDNGTPLKDPDGLGTGIPGMRLAIEEVGGTFFVETVPRFVVRALVPRCAPDLMELNIEGRGR